MTDPMEPAADPHEDPFMALAHVRARRAMADLAGFDHHPSWDGIEADALRRLGRRDAADPVPDAPRTPDDAKPSPAPAQPIDDPLLAFARVTALRLAADSAGVPHDPTWDTTEAAIGDQLHREAAGADAVQDPDTA